jgi:hypothetical protein
MTRNEKIAIGAAVAALLAVILWYIFRDRTPEVPLGVEHAVTIAYSGPELTVAPYKFGVPVNVRIAEVIENDGIRTYDIRYMLNTGGEFNIIEYLTTKDGSSTEELPSFTVRGIESLSQQMDQRIETIEESGIQIWHYYYETMTAIIALWIACLFLLIFWKRDKPKAALEVESAPSFYELMGSFLDQIEKKTIDDKTKAEMEMLVIRWWRDQLGYSDLEMREVMRRLREDKNASTAFTRLQEWIHNPKHSVNLEELLESLRPLSVKPESTPS